MTFASSILGYFKNLDAPVFTNGIEIFNPYKTEEVMRLVERFYFKYFNDQEQRVFIVGINPGRFGGGLTGISFTDPVALKEFCGIDNSISEKRELSSRFIYSMIEAFGGPEVFYKKFYLTALYPLAIVKEGKNFNYYDEPELFRNLYPSIISSLKDQVNSGARKDIAICLGKKNFTYVQKINKEYNFFKELKVVEHPRYIMQYKLKKLDYYIDQYLKVLHECEMLV